MPELPEVEGFRRRLAPLILGQRIRRLDVRDPKLWRPAPGLDTQAVDGRTVQSLQRRAKLLIMSLDGGLTLVTHLKIAGQLVYESWAPDGTAPPPESHGVAPGATRLVGGHPYPLPGTAFPDASTRFVLSLQGGTLFVNDQRRFAWLRLLPSTELESFIAEQRYGPDPLDAGFTPAVLAARLRARKGRPIKAALLDQTCVAGLGNIYANEALHGARLYPMIRCGDLSPTEVEQLHAAIGGVLEVAVPVGGALVKVGRAVPDPHSGRDFLRAHGRAGESCLTCAAEGRGDGARIVRVVMAGRGTYFCPVCQPAR
ncbi:MAG TPA: DNA-formamidopyrimidine glycosylase family protein [Chloroflexota bacterium]|nr:DNA-formamidopyrimidine glycosylase family protein [Chloroflexota bacterium]